jgi:hypothetical protein
MVYNHSHAKLQAIVEEGEAPSINPDALSALLEANPNAVFVYNTAKDPNNPKVGGGDYMFDKIPEQNKLGIITMKTHTGHTVDPTSSLYQDVNNEVDEEFKNNVDAAIKELLELRDQKGKTLIFNEHGYAGYMAGIDRNTGKASVKITTVSPQNFLYLSSELYRVFGYVNPGYTLPSIEATEQEAKRLYKFDKETVLDLIKKCRG